MRAVKRAAPPADTALIRLPSWIGFGGFIPLDLLILSALAACKRSDTAWFFGIAVGGAAALRNLATFMVRRQRPSLWAKLGMERTRKASFPSGHAMGAMALAAALSSMAWPTGWRWPAALLSGSSVLLVGASRIVREEHYPSDILAGWAAALAWVRGCDAWVMRERREQRASR